MRTAYVVAVTPFPSQQKLTGFVSASLDEPLTRWTSTAALPHLQGSSQILIFLLTAHCPPYSPHTPFTHF